MTTTWLLKGVPTHFGMGLCVLSSLALLLAEPLVQ